ncbi:extracellular sulfatase Sulf-2 [Pimephales promelas]|nr:extracellular sulfatase Sulf-2 [Pimephales promelas]
MAVSAPSLQTPVSSVLTSGNNYDIDAFLDQIEKVVQSNDQILSDEAMEFDATVVMSRRGGVRRKLTDLAVDQRYIDSYAFIPMGLAKMPSALDLTTAEKGYFPHLFNRVENENYFGPYPDKKFYNYDNMSDKGREEFDKWYSTVEGEWFDFKKELYAYGVNDVVLLREGCMKYREAFIQCTELDPFRFTTLASCSMGVFKTHYLEKNTLALTHNNAYVHQTKSYSAGSIEWLEYLKKTRNVDIHHAVNYGEVSFGNYFLDGYYEQDGVKRGLEYNGCLFHGHNCRFEPHHTHPMSGVSFGVLRRQFDEKVEILQNAYGLQIEVLWECEWGRMKKTNASVIEFMSTYTPPERLKPRDALFGGRTNAYKLYHKQQASGYPSNVVTDAEKAAYIQEYFEKEDIHLDPEKIKYNPAQRSINKLLLNALWGRFSMREQLPQTSLVNDPEEFTRIVFGNTDTLTYFTFVSDDVALVQHKPAKGDVCKTRDINVFVGAFTTAHARLELYELMDKLGDRVLYSDTDSVIFVSRDGDWEPPLGDHLGELTNEIDDGDYITEFCSSGPKSYGFRTVKGKVCMKAKGITLNAKNSQAIRLDTLIGLVDSYVSSHDSTQYIMAYTENIVRNKKTLTLHNKSVAKRFKVVYNKRRLLPDFTTVPYGY